MSEPSGCSWDELLRLFPSDRYLSFDVDRASVIRAASTATAWSFRGRSTYWSADWVTVWSRGQDSPERAADVAEHFAWHQAADDGGHIRGITCNEVVPIPSASAVAAANDWSWMWTDQSHARVHAQSSVVAVDHADPRLVSLLAHSPTASHERDGVPPTGWFGLFEGEELISVAAVKRQGDCTFISSVVTHRDARGRGMASAVCSHVTAWALGQAPVVALGMMSDNAIAERMYAQLGFRVEKRWQSARFEIGEPSRR